MKSLRVFCVAITVLTLVASLVACGKMSKKEPLPGGVKVQFYETYNKGEVKDQINSLIDAVSKQEGEQSAQSLKKMCDETEEMAPNLQVLLYASEADTAFVNEMIDKYRNGTMKVDLKTAWTIKPENTKYGKKFELVALKATGASGMPSMTGETITDVEVEKVQGQYSISIIMNDQGAKEWARLTEKNINKNIAIVFNGKVYSYPNVRSRVDGGRTQIAGNFTKQDADELASALKGEK